VIQGTPAVPASLPEADLAEFCFKNTTVGVAVSFDAFNASENISHKHWDNKHIIFKIYPYTVAQDHIHYHCYMIYFEDSST
jgi:hypothetical protein